MAVRVAVPYSASFRLPLSRDAAFRYLTTWEQSLKKSFPGVEEFVPAGTDTYRWRFEKIAYGGYEFAIGFTTRFESTAPTEIRMVPVQDSGGHRLEGSWHLEEQGKETEVQFRANLEIELPIPFFLKGMATPLTQKEIGGLFQRYVERVAKNCPVA